MVDEPEDLAVDLGHIPGIRMVLGGPIPDSIDPFHTDQDMLFVLLDNGFRVDAGWYDDHFAIMVVLDDWLNPVEVVRTAIPREVPSIVERLVMKYTAPTR